MKKKVEIYQNLFGKEKSNLWYNENIHNSLVAKIVSYLVSNQTEDNIDLNEDEIQSVSHKFLNHKLNNTEYRAKREPNAFDQKRLDNLVDHIKSDTAMVYYEIKTMIKSKENKLNPNSVYPDIIKLAIKKKEEPNCRVYFLLAGKEKVFKEAIEISKTVVLPNKFEDKYNRKSILLTIEFLKKEITQKKFIGLIAKMEELGIKKISISPSRWKIFESMAVLTWKINKVK